VIGSYPICPLQSKISDVLRHHHHALGQGDFGFDFAEISALTL
jgi:hypothetical protein